MSGDKFDYEIVAQHETSKDFKASNVAPKASKGFGARHIQTLLLFICLTVAYTMRAQLSVSMVAMTSHNSDNITTCDNFMGNLTIQYASYIMSCNGSRSINKWNVYRAYDWNKATQEMIMFSFFVGYTSMMMPMGCLAQRFGGKKPIMLALAVNGVISIITPWVPVYGGWLGICICRLLQGATQAAIYPSIHTILGKWAPLSERGRLGTYIYTGSQFGTIVIFQIAGLFAGNPSLGWPATFWLCGLLSLASCGLLAWLGSATPHDHPSITVEEINYIMEGGGADVTSEKRRTPWKSILTSMPVWGLIATHAGSAAGYLLVLTQIPTYMNFVLGVEIKKNGVFSSLPYVAMYVTALLFGFLADYAVNKKILSVVNIRRIANSIGMALGAVALLIFSFVSSTVSAVIDVLIISLSLHSAIHVGFHINHIDLAPNFAGPIMALGNMVANLTSLLVPVVVSNIVKDDMRNQGRWQIVFSIFAGVQVLTNVVFVIFAKGQVQPWNFYGEDNDNTSTAERYKKKSVPSEEKLNST